MHVVKKFDFSRLFSVLVPKNVPKNIEIWRIYGSCILALKSLLYIF